MSVWEEAKHPREKDGKFGNAKWASKLSDAIGGGETLKGDSAYNSLPSAYTLPGADVKAIEAYTGGKYVPINALHRDPNYNPKFPSERATVQGWSNSLDHLFVQTPATKQPMEVTRHTNDATRMFGPRGDSIGRVFTDKGFVSTTTLSDPVRSVWDDPAEITIHIPAGNKVVRLEAYKGEGDYEKELLLNRGSRFKIVGDKMGVNIDGEVRQIQLELL